MEFDTLRIFYSELLKYIYLETVHQRNHPLTF